MAFLAVFYTKCFHSVNENQTDVFCILKHNQLKVVDEAVRSRNESVLSLENTCFICDC